MAKQFFTNKDGNTLIKEFEGLLEHNKSIAYLDSVVGFLRASGYFTLRPFLNNIKKARILVGIDVDKYIVNAHNKGKMFIGASVLYAFSRKNECIFVKRQWNFVFKSGWRFFNDQQSLCCLKGTI